MIVLGVGILLAIIVLLLTGNMLYAVLALALLLIVAGVRAW